MVLFMPWTVFSENIVVGKRNLRKAATIVFFWAQSDGERSYWRWAVHVGSMYYCRPSAPAWVSIYHREFWLIQEIVSTLHCLRLLLLKAVFDDDIMYRPRYWLALFHRRSNVTQELNGDAKRHQGRVWKECGWLDCACKKRSHYRAEPP